MILLCDHFWPHDDSKSHCLVTDYRSVEASEVVMVIALRLSAPINHLPLNKGFPILCLSQKLHFAWIKPKHQHLNLLLLFLLPKWMPLAEKWAFSTVRTQNQSRPETWVMWSLIKDIWPQTLLMCVCYTNFMSNLRTQEAGSISGCQGKERSASCPL